MHEDFQKWLSQQSFSCMGSGAELRTGVKSSSSYPIWGKNPYTQSRIHSPHYLMMLSELERWSHSRRDLFCSSAIRRAASSSRKQGISRTSSDWFTSRRLHRTRGKALVKSGQASHHQPAQRTLRLIPTGMFGSTPRSSTRASARI